MDLTVIGAGNGALAAAGHAALNGHRVRLWDRYLDPDSALVRSGQITLAGAVSGVATVDATRPALGDAVAGADLVMVVVPGFAISWIAGALAPHVRPGQSVLLHPGGTGGALEVAHIWGAAGTGVVLGATDTLAYACRVDRDGTVGVHALKKHLMVSAVDSARTAALTGLVRQLYPQAAAEPSILDVLFANLNPVIHPPITLLNAGRIEAGQHFRFYGDGVGPGVAALIRALDAERVAVARAYGCSALDLDAWIERAYQVRDRDLVRLFAVLDRDVYHGLASPSAIESRYLTEDLPFGLACTAEFAAVAGVPVPVTDAVLRVGRTLCATPPGRTLADMGLAGLTAGEISAMAA
ncbi:NAD/NADP octopine/nopaline dehydrogenase family protein [Phytohabitans sp. ZYX-F-186]|uniref:NAD/NADP octopine/nopaline dehydrogenase family protein n=1 Tax=Phytohabitans maris TaxID=3071409 RepID=A0ABU0ZJY7_9ACTN|nr:NAD/NADP octopine/nopaline dehydrogenase family protein [Phytohabitans sp. ZYX-F-186]MDQ7906262.1 NAD/NADP octopine/nopaline dehydrogenase family protein [Phytohabitans sp. ZYX-F-186]